MMHAFSFLLWCVILYVIYNELILYDAEKEEISMLQCTLYTHIYNEINI